MSIRKIEIKPLYQKDNGLFVVDINTIPLPNEFAAKERCLVAIPPKTLGGNHRHPRTEIFATLDAGVELHWVDEATGQKNIESMSPSDKIYAFVVPPMVPHAVLNTSDTSATLIEFANGPQENVEPYPVI